MAELNKDRENYERWSMIQAATAEAVAHNASGKSKEQMYHTCSRNKFRVKIVH